MPAAADALPGGDHAVSSSADSVPGQLHCRINRLPRDADAMPGSHHPLSSTGDDLSQCGNHLPHRADPMPATRDGLYNRLNCIGGVGGERASLCCHRRGMSVTNGAGGQELTRACSSRNERSPMVECEAAKYIGRLFLCRCFPGWELW